MKIYIYLLIFYLGIFSVTPTKLPAKDSFTIGLLAVSDKQIKAYEELVDTFEAATGITVTLKIYSDRGYKNVLEKWLTSGDGPDVLYWQGGERFYRLIRAGYVEPIDRLWEKEKLDQLFTKTARELIVLRDKPYGIPFSYYHWGFYYRKSLFKKYNLSPPETWDAFLAVCEVLKSNGITPFTIGTGDKWTAAGWFDYLNIRQNGISFRQQLLTGNISYHDKRVRNVLLKWKELIDKDYFVKDAGNMPWDLALPYLYRNIAGMYLIGNFVEGKIIPEMKEDFSFFKFPRLNENMPFYELAPTDIFFIPDYALKKRLGKKFLLYLAQADIQTKLCEKLDLIPVNAEASVSSDRLIQEGYKVLKKAKGFAQFFDRDCPSEISKEGIDVFADFLETADIYTTIERLETLRKRFLASGKK